MLRSLLLLGLALAYDCVFEAPDGVSYDLSNMRQSSPPDYSVMGTDFFEYRVNVCEQAFQSCAGDFTGVATQWNPQGSCVAVIGRQNPEFGGLNLPTLDYIDEDNPEKGVVLTYANGDLCPGLVAFERTARYVINCDKSTKGTVISASEPQICTYQIEFNSKAACPPARASADKASKKRVTVFKQVLVGLVLVFVLYCVAGSYRNYRNEGTSFPDSMPHKDFWFSLPGYLSNLVSSLILRVKAWKEGYQMPEGSVPI